MTKGEAVQAAIKRSKGQGKGAEVKTYYGAPLREEPAFDEEPPAPAFGSVACADCGAIIPADESIGDDGQDFCFACAGVL